MHAHEKEAEICVLENGKGLRSWVERAVRESEIDVIRCATFAVGAPGLLWLTGLARSCASKIKLLSDTGQSDPRIITKDFREFVERGRGEWRLLPQRPGSSLTTVGWFHPKVLLLGKHAAVVGSANLTGCGLGLSIPPHHIEMSIGLRGSNAREAIDVLFETFERWWESGHTIELLTTNQKPDAEATMNPMPDYVVFEIPPRLGNCRSANGRRGECLGNLAGRFSGSEGKTSERASQRDCPNIPPPPICTWAIPQPGRDLNTT